MRLPRTLATRIAHAATQVSAVPDGPLSAPTDKARGTADVIDLGPIDRDDLETARRALAAYALIAPADDIPAIGRVSAIIDLRFAQAHRGSGGVAGTVESAPDCAGEAPTVPTTRLYELVLDCGHAWERLAPTPFAAAQDNARRYSASLVRAACRECRQARRITGRIRRIDYELVLDCGHTAGLLPFGLVDAVAFVADLNGKETWCPVCRAWQHATDEIRRVVEASAS